MQQPQLEPVQILSELAVLSQQPADAFGVAARVRTLKTQLAAQMEIAFGSRNSMVEQLELVLHCLFDARVDGILVGPLREFS
jgi:hypothetical protein